jgi:carbon storage regulator
MILILSRRPGEEIQIGDDVVVRVVFVGAGKVRLAFSAPPEVRIVRTELLPEETVREN